MSQHYSDPKRETEPTALPDVEVFRAPMWECEACDASFTGCETGSAEKVPCPECGSKAVSEGQRDAWWWWSCFPGCMPDGEPMGPFATEAEALEDARAGMENDEEDSDDEEIDEA